MIIDKLDHASIYAPTGSRISKAFDFLRRRDLATMADGKYEIDGTDVFALVQSYTTNPREKGQFEAHRKYIDVQFVVSGEESMGYANLADIKITEPYNEKDDYLLGTGTPDWVHVRPGMFTIFNPQDAHIPCCVFEKPEQIKKVVVKVRV